MAEHRLDYPGRMNSAPRSTTAPANGNRTHPAAHPVASLEHLDLDAGAVKRVGGGQPGESGADDDRSHTARYSGSIFQLGRSAIAFR